MQKWKEFNAGVILSKAELQELLEDGVKVNPMQWVETDKNGFKRRHDKSIPPDLKSRLVGLGSQWFRAQTAFFVGESALINFCFFSSPPVFDYFFHFLIIFFAKISFYTFQQRRSDYHFANVWVGCSRLQMCAVLKFWKTGWHSPSQNIYMYV